MNIASLRKKLITLLYLYFMKTLYFVLNPYLQTLGLWSLPDVLVLHLKRFKQTQTRRTKVNLLVDFPVESLDMSPYLVKQNPSNASHHGDDVTYELLGVCNHYGSMAGGHYTSFCLRYFDWLSVCLFVCCISAACLSACLSLCLPVLILTIYVNIMCGSSTFSILIL